MAAPPKPYTFTPDTKIAADEVNADFDAIFDWIRDQAIHTDGTNAFSTIPSLPPTNPTTPNQVVRKGYVDQQLSNAPTVRHHILSSSTVSFGTGQTTIPGTTISATFSSGRLYRFSAAGVLEINPGGSGYLLRVTRNGTELARLDQKNANESLGELAQGSYVTTMPAGTFTIALTIRSIGAAGGRMRGDLQSIWMTIEDLGPA